MPEGRWFSEEEVRAAVAHSRSYAEALRWLGLRAAGGNHRTIRKYVEDVWRIPVDHFAPARGGSSGRAVPLADVLVEGSTYHRGHLKRRLLAEGLKRPECEMCGQGERWRGRRMSLVLDHINGVHDDHRLEKLRMSATAAGQVVRLRVARPAYEQLVREIEALGDLGVGRRYGVSDNAIRKWRRSYEAALATEPTAGTVLDASAADRAPEEARREVTPGAAR